MNMVINHPRAVYATQPGPLQNQIAGLLTRANGTSLDGEVCAIIVPDDNKLDGGTVAAGVYKALEGQRFDTVILIAPSHTEAFRRITICELNTSQTPLGVVQVNDALRNELCDEDDDIFLDDEGHYHPAGVDVQLPFLQSILDAFDIVPIVMGEESPSFCKELGHALGEVAYNRRTLIVACANVLEASEEDLASFKSSFEAGNVSRLMMLLNSETVRMQGKGAVLVALIAAMHRYSVVPRILDIQPPNGDHSGYIGAVLCRA
jgi:AmmeMemoRadiSam system protein B